MGEMAIINEIIWHKQLDIASLAHGTVVINVPLDHPIFENQLTRGLNMCLNDLSHWKKVNEMILRKQLLPVYYCLKCNQMEDGRHRTLATRVMGNKTIDIRLWDSCYRNNKVKMRMLENKIMGKDFKWEKS